MNKQSDEIISIIKHNFEDIKKSDIKVFEKYFIYFSLLKELKKIDRTLPLVKEISQEIALNCRDIQLKFDKNYIIEFSDEEIISIYETCISDKDSRAELINLLECLIFVRKDDIECEIKTNYNKFPMIYSFNHPILKKDVIYGYLNNLSLDDIKNKNNCYKDWIIFSLVQKIHMHSIIIYYLWEKYLDRAINPLDDLKDILNNTFFIKDVNQESFYTLLEMFSKKEHTDIETCTQKLIPLVENGIKNICVLAGVNPNKIDNNKEIPNTLGYLISIPEITKIIGEDECLYIKTLFDSSIGFNLRNYVCHGILDSSDYNCYYIYYAILFVIFITYKLKNK